MAKVEIRSIKIEFNGGWVGDPNTGDHYLASGRVQVGNKTLPLDGVRLSVNETEKMKALFQEIAQRLSGKGEQ